MALIRELDRYLGLGHPGFDRFRPMAALAFARYRVGGSWLPIYVLSFRMIPPIAIAIPVAVLLAPLNVTNTPMLLPPIYAAITVPLSTWMLKSFIEQTP